MRDRFNRTIDYMRISITDRCNLRCRYCMPDGIELVPMCDVMTYEEIVRIADAAAELGVRSIKITGGEPLVRRGCAELIGMLKNLSGIEQVTMTTNGILLEKYLPDLMKAGLDAVNVSLDTLDPERFASITGKDGLSSVLSGIRAAIDEGLKTKINTVLMKGINEDEWLSLASMAFDQRLDVRFIEMMPIGFGAGMIGVSNEWLLQKFREEFGELTTDPSVHGNGPAVYLRAPGWKGSIGFISAIHGKFCLTCNRVRLTARGKMKPCLCYGDSIDLLPMVRSGCSDDELRRALEHAIIAKPQQHCFEKPDRVTEKSRMSGIGG